MPNEPFLSSFEDALLDSLLEQVVVIDARGRIRWANDAWVKSAKLRGANPDAVSPGASYVRVLEESAATDDDVARILEGIRAVLHGSIQQFEEEYECSGNGEFRYFVERVTPLKHPDGGAVIAHLDITRQKLAERERDSQGLQLARAASAAALGQLSGAIAHEVRQPLTALLSNVHFVQISLGKTAADAEVVSALQDIERDAERANNILGRIRDLLRHGQPRSEMVDINDVIKETLTLCARQLQAHEIHVELSLSPELAPVHGDSIGLQQVILNLIINSYEALKSSETRDRRLEISTSKADPGHVTIVVADTGPGLTKEAAERLFEPLFTTKPSGTGLGLSISRSIVEAHDGTLSIVSRPCQGAIGKIALPIAASAAGVKDPGK